MLEQLVQVIGRLLGIPSLFFGLEVDKCRAEAIRIPSGPFYKILVCQLGNKEDSHLPQLSVNVQAK